LNARRRREQDALEFRRTYLRLLVFVLDLGLSFAILVLYVAFEEALGLVVLLITASVFAASREDLTELKEKKSLIIVLLLFSAGVFFFAVYFFEPYSLALFYGLIIANFGLLLGYVALRLQQRRMQNSLFGR
jgi:dipeptide/tripeptide permease